MDLKDLNYNCDLKLGLSLLRNNPNAVGKFKFGYVQHSMKSRSRSANKTGFESCHDVSLHEVSL